MRILSPVFWFAGAILLASPAQAEKRTFIVANHADSYGIDRCLATGASCGKPVAAAYCRAQDFAEVLTFRKIERADVTGSLAAGAATCRGLCEDLIAIECSR